VLQPPEARHLFATPCTMGDIGSVDMDPHLRHRGVANWNKSEPNDAPEQMAIDSIEPEHRTFC